MGLGGMAVAPVTRGLQGLPICGRGASFDSREGGGSGEVPGGVGGGRCSDKLVWRASDLEPAHALAAHLIFDEFCHAPHDF